MDAIPLIVLLIPYGIVLLIAVIFLFFNVFHLFRYGIEGSSTTLLAGSYVVIFLLVVAGTLVLLAPYPWRDTFSTEDLLPSDPGLKNYGL